MGKTIRSGTVPVLMLLVPTAVMAENAGEDSRPNILWLTFEDTSWYELGCYGNKSAKTPVIDSLAKEGIIFQNAYSCGPQSSPARSTLITGCYATTYAMDWHRHRVKTPEDIFFPEYLRKAGYFCTNNKKTDYNSLADDKTFWDECGTEASYNSPARAESQPFFAVFNSNQTHMSRLTSVHTDGRRNFSKEGLAPKSLELPPYVPDIYQVRSDYALHLEGVQDIDRWVRIFIEDLKARGLDKDTIIFIFSDHGGCLPRGKAFSYETSFRVPMIAYFPEKYRHLAGRLEGHTGQLVCFADMAPTMLSLAGVEIPGYMQGHAFLGPQKREERKYQYGFMCNRAFHYVPSRTVSDGRYKYIRYYIPYKKDALFNYFQWQMPANLWWDRTYFSGKCDRARSRPYEYAPAEALYDISADPYELHNLIGAPAFSLKAASLREQLSRHIRQTGDLGFLPDFCREGRCPYDYARAEGYDIEKLYRLAEMTVCVSEDDLEELLGILSGDMPDEFKYWATVNLAVLAGQGKLSCGTELLEEMLEENEDIAQEAAYALCLTQDREAGFSYLAQHPENTTALEILSLEKEFRKSGFPRDVMEMLRTASWKYEQKDRKKMPNGNDGIGARKVLVNLGEIPADELYGDKIYEIGKRVNMIRKKTIPLP